MKKLPGVEVGTDGSITANGETIKKITIDGKTFFLDDPQLASKNIPAKIVDKIKVVEKKSDQAMFTGIDDGEEETVIDLKLRPGMAKGWFGNVMAGTVLLALFYGLLPWFAKLGIPAFLHGYFDLFSGAIQAYVFSMLTMVFVSQKAETE